MSPSTAASAGIRPSASASIARTASAAATAALRVARAARHVAARSVHVQCERGRVFVCRPVSLEGKAGVRVGVRVSVCVCGRHRCRAKATWIGRALQPWSATAGSCPSPTAARRAPARARVATHCSAVATGRAAVLQRGSCATARFDFGCVLPLGRTGYPRGTRRLRQGSPRGRRIRRRGRC